MLNRENLSLIVAGCAIAVSAASFYATYLQARAADQQVKAMTYPLIEFSHGNYDGEARERRVYMNLKNAGVGPAIVKRVSFAYADHSFDALNNWIEACCDEANDVYMDRVRAANFEATDWTMTTAEYQDIILPVGGEVTFLSLRYDERNKPLWDSLNRERWKLTPEICYCSLLDDCYATDGAGQVTNLPSCDVTP